jgi:chemotaxis protein MotB
VRPEVESVHLPHELEEEESGVKKGAPAWVVTFGDIMCLLMCFFVLLLSFSSMETERFKIVAGHIREAFGVQVGQRHTEIPAGATVVGTEYQHPSPSKAMIYERLEDLIAKRRLDGLVSITIAEDGVRLDLRDGLLFAPGSTELSDKALPFLDEVADVIREFGGFADIGGHTDAAGAEGEAASEAWVLSSARAAVVAERLEAQGIPGPRLAATGYAGSRPLSESRTEEGRRKNRRVEILIRSH